MSDTDSDDSSPGDEESRRLSDILYSKKKRNKQDKPLPVDFQKLEKDAQEYVERVGENFLVDVPKTLQSIGLGSEAHQQQLNVKSHEDYLTEQTTLVIEERRREIQATQKRLEISLRELAAVKLKEEETLRRKVKELQKEFADSMKTLQKQFCTQAEELRQNVLRKVAQQRSQCEMAIEAKARLLSASLATGNQSNGPSSTRGCRAQSHISDLEDSSELSDYLCQVDNPVSMHPYGEFPIGSGNQHRSSDIRRHSVGFQDANKQTKGEHVVKSQRRHSTRASCGGPPKGKMAPNVCSP